MKHSKKTQAILLAEFSEGGKLILEIEEDSTLDRIKEKIVDSKENIRIRSYLMDAISDILNGESEFKVSELNDEIIFTPMKKLLSIKKLLGIE
jgi:hypothetical protein